MKLAAIFTDNMVLQANKPLRVFGEGNGAVKVRFKGEEYFSRGKDGKWEVELPPQPYGGPFDMEISQGEEKRALKNVMIGEVLLCAGQSNMQFTVGEEQLSEEYEYKVYDAIRIFVQERVEEYEGLKSGNGWVVCAKETLKYWTAIGYHVARLLHENEGVAVGVVGCYQGASIIESWIDEKIITRPEYFVPEEQRRFNKKHALYERYGKWNIYGKLYRETFSKIIPFAVGKVIWYQGESNTSVAESKMYAKWLKALVDSWRADLKDSDIPFIIVQIADLDGTGEEWTSLQKAQEQAVKEIPLSELVVSKDISDRTNIHPADKLALSERIYKALYD